MRLYPHQRKAFRAVFAALNQDINQQLVVMPTGGGKTYLFSHVIKRRGGRALILAHRDELLTQAYDAIKTIMPRARVGIVRAGEDGSDQRIVIASVQSLSRSHRLRQITNHFRTIVIDEAHHAAAPTYQRIINFFAESNPLILGVTATPVRDNNEGLDDLFKIVSETSIAEGVHQGWLSDVEGKLIHLKGADFSKIHTKRGDLDLTELEIIMNAANWHEYVSKAYFEHAAGRKTIIFVPNVAMAHELADWMRGQGAKAEAVDGAMRIEKRRDIIERLANNQLDAVINCAVLTEGFDDPSLSCVIMARPTKSWGLYVQCIGRGLRYQPNKTCLVLDMVGGTVRHDLVTLPRLANVDELGEGETLSWAIERGEREAKERVRIEGEMEARRVEMVEGNTPKHGFCPICGSDKVRSYAYYDNGDKRYHCLACKRFFSRERRPAPRCLYCQSSRTRKSGRLPGGKQKYHCRDCNKSFNESTQKCPSCAHCGSSQTFKAGKNVPSGTQGYKCRDCKRKFTPRAANPPCRFCQSANTIKAGQGSAIQKRKQRYRCNDCHRAFRLNPSPGAGPKPRK